MHMNTCKHVTDWAPPPIWDPSSDLSYIFLDNSCFFLLNTKTKPALSLLLYYHFYYVLTITIYF